VAECFCGCGRDVPFRWRPVNNRGREIEETIDEVRSSPGGGRSLADREYVKEAKRACERLAEAVHQEREADKALEAESRALLRKHRDRYPKRGLPFFGRWQVRRR
jgi:hypothetical protein